MKTWPSGPTISSSSNCNVSSSSKPCNYCRHCRAGFVGADLTALCKEAAAIAVTRIFDGIGVHLPAFPTSDAPSATAATSTACTAVDDEMSSPAGHSAPSTNVLPVSAGAAVAPEGASASFKALSQSRFGAGPLGASELQGLAITMSDFEAAVHKVQPSMRRARIWDAAFTSMDS